VSLVYDTLLAYTAVEGLTSNLAERWELDPDGVSLVFWLNPLAMWHDGRPVTAEDVVFSFNLVRNRQFPGMVTVAALIDRVEAPTPQEVKFVLLARRADAVRLLGSQVRIVPSHLWKDVSDPLSYPGLDQPVGSGPFAWVVQNDGGQKVLVSTGTHHCAKPRISALVLETMHDEAKALEMLQSADLDALGWDIGMPVASELLNDSDDDGAAKLLECPGVCVTTLLLNLRKAPYDNVTFRHVLAQAIDPTAVVDEVLTGLGDEATPGLFPPASPWRNKDITPIAPNPQQAMETLDAAGFLDRDGDGLRENPDGSTLLVPVTCSDLPVSLHVAGLVVAYWEAIGISAEVRAIAQDLIVPTLMEAGFDVILYSVSLSEPPMAFFHFHTSRGLVEEGRVFGLNYGGYANPEYDDIVTAASEELDPAIRQDLLYQLQRILAADLPQIPLYVPRVLNAYRDDRFTGWNAEPGIGLLYREGVLSLTER
jgi:peptide/nickel transport system substrate-binding protein